MSNARRPQLLCVKYRWAIISLRVFQRTGLFQNHSGTRCILQRCTAAKCSAAKCIVVSFESLVFVFANDNTYFKSKQLNWFCNIIITVSNYCPWPSEQQRLACLAMMGYLIWVFRLASWNTSLERLKWHTTTTTPPPHPTSPPTTTEFNSIHEVHWTTWVVQWWYWPPLQRSNTLTVAVLLSQ